MIKIKRGKIWKAIIKDIPKLAYKTKSNDTNTKRKGGRVGREV